MSRTRCSVLHAAPQSRDPHNDISSMGPGSALRPGHEKKPARQMI